MFGGIDKVDALQHVPCPLRLKEFIEGCLAVRTQIVLHQSKVGCCRIQLLGYMGHHCCPLMGVMGVFDLNKAFTCFGFCNHKQLCYSLSAVLIILMRYPAAVHKALAGFTDKLVRG